MVRFGNETQLRRYEGFRRSGPRRTRSEPSPENVGVTDPAILPDGLATFAISRYTCLYEDQDAAVLLVWSGVRAGQAGP
jgi:hypothetical protein